MIYNYEIAIYKTAKGKEPYTEWIKSLDQNASARMDARLTRIEKNGNMGDCEPVGDGVFELKFDFGPGYRIYFGYETDKILILLLGGYKKGQQKNIDKARSYWNEYILQKGGKK
jgi:putative addiction module killer protein